MTTLPAAGAREPQPRRRLALAALLVAAAAVLALNWPGGEAAPPGGAGSVAAAGDREPRVVVSSDPADVDRRPLAAAPAAVLTPNVPEADLAHPHAFALDLLLLDAFGLPVVDAMVFVAPPTCGFTLWPERSDAFGRVRLTWRGRVRTMPVQLAVLVWGVLQPIRLVEVEAGRPSRCAMVAQGRQQAAAAIERAASRKDFEYRRDVSAAQHRRRRPGRMERTDELDVLCGRSQLLFRAFECLDCHEPSVVARYAPLSRCGTMRPGLHPGTRFEDLRANGLQGRELSERQAALKPRDDVEQDGVPSQSFRSGSIAGVVTTAAGRPAAEVPVAWLDATGALRHRTTTDEWGRYRLMPVGVGAISLVAGGGDVGSASTIVVTDGGFGTQWNCQLTPTSVVRGTASDVAGAPLSGWRVEFDRPEGDWAGAAITDADGGFVFTGVPGGGQCLLWPKGEDCRLPVISGEAALVDATPVALALDPDRPTRARLRVHPVLPPGHDLQRVDARLQQLDSGRVAQMAAMGFEDAFVVENLPPGPYRIELGAPGLGWAETAVVIDGRGLWDLGRVHLPAPGRVVVRTTDGAPSPLDGAHAFYRRTPAVDVLAEYHRGPDGEVTLAAGDYVLVWPAAAGLRAVEFAVTSAVRREIIVAMQP